MAAEAYKALVLPSSRQWLCLADPTRGEVICQCRCRTPMLPRVAHIGHRHIRLLAPPPTPRGPPAQRLAVIGTGVDRNSHGANNYQRDRPTRLGLVAVIAIVVVVVHEPPKALVVLISRLQYPRRPGHLRLGDLDLDLRLGSDVEKPPRRAVIAAVRGNKDILIAIPGIDERVRALSRASPASRAQQKRGHPDHPVAHPPVGTLIERLVKPEKGSLDRRGQAHIRTLPAIRKVRRSIRPHACSARSRHSAASSRCRSAP